MRNHRLAIAALAALGLAGGACAAPRVLTSQDIVGERAVKYTYQKTAVLSDGQNSKALYDYSVRVCDYGDDAAPKACKDTLVLRNVSSVH